jgi:hypothetical protein
MSHELYKPQRIDSDGKSPSSESVPCNIALVLTTARAPLIICAYIAQASLLGRAIKSMSLNIKNVVLRMQFQAPVLLKLGADVSMLGR